PRRDDRPARRRPRARTPPCGGIRRGLRPRPGAPSSPTAGASARPAAARPAAVRAPCRRRRRSRRGTARRRRGRPARMECGVVPCACAEGYREALAASGIMAACRLFRCRKGAMRVLVSNDDGVDAPGIHALARGLREAGHEVVMVAPDRDRSGASNSLTLDAPVRVVQVGELAWKVYGTPTDCVHVAITGMLDTLGLEPDIVVSGINNTANLGDDVIYSGTVAAAMEGRFLGLPAVAVSLVTADHHGRHYESAARAAVEIIARLQTDPLPANTI